MKVYYVELTYDSIFSRLIIIMVAVKKSSDALVRALEEAWSQPQPLPADLCRTFQMLENSFDATTAQAYVAYCDNLDDARSLFRRAT